MDESSQTVALQPPLDVMRPRPADEIPEQGSVPGGLQYSLKLDGFRALAFVLEGGRVFLQSRSGRDLTRDFPQVSAYLQENLPSGIVLDGELCAYRDGRLNFTDLLRSRADRERSGVPVYYVAFDILAIPGTDVRGLPLRERWELLGAALGVAEPPLQRVLATLEEETARLWFREMRAVGVEGIVAKSLSSTYQPGETWAWRKIRHSDTRDAGLLGVFGPQQRPHALLVELPDGRTVKTSPRLTAMQARQVGESVRGRLGEQTEHPEHGLVTLLIEPVLVEVRETAGRHGSAKFVRVRFEG
ncbi:DNA ligase [Streptomyces sp. H34-S4]|uniref:ATP-dependent DNA ligase n=1 Tax=Streptomyces sp. H34-S4 TaxID=2996463 RepID=UPI00226F5883|nr:DNA ligase [Streptomyces sp. H34-S4]MCY0933393.1 DNA ligase [Streptomyces sp. H34-S4]